MKKALLPVVLLVALAAGCAVQVPDVRVNLTTPPLQRKAIGENRVPPPSVADVTVSILAEMPLPPVREARVRQKRRRANLDSLEARGVVGEAADGTVVPLHPELVHSSLERRRVSKLIDAENRDRKVVKKWLERILAQTIGGSQPSLPETLARAYHELAPPGSWVQTQDGTWVRKEK